MHIDHEIFIENITVGYDSNIVLRKVSFHLDKDEVIGIIGQNGSGKSTLLKAVCGMLPLSEGEITVRDKKLEYMQTHRLIDLGISYFSQSGLVIPALTVEEHLLLALKCKEKKLNEAEIVYSEFPQLKALRKQRAGNLSGGERQILSFGILLLQNHEIWLLDEPTSGLSPEMVDYSVDFLIRMKRERSISMLLVEHNMEVAFQIADKIVVVEQQTVSDKFERNVFTKDNFLTNHVYN